MILHFVKDIDDGGVDKQLSIEISDETQTVQTMGWAEMFTFGFLLCTYVKCVVELSFS